MNKCVNLVLITDNGFAVLTGVAIYSLKRNSNPDYHYKVNVLCSDVDECHVRRLKELSSENFEINVLYVDGSRFSEYSKGYLHVSTTALFKFDLANIFENEDKILYVDGDVLIQSDLVDLYNTDISGVYAGVTVDYGGLTWPSDFKKRLKTRHRYYFNSGMMLLNLKKMREDGIPAKLLDYRLNGINHYMDQDAFNIVLREKVKYLSLNNNFVITAWRDFDESVLTGFFGLEKRDRKIDYLKEAGVVHFASPDKPSKYIDTPYANVWYSYFCDSPFGDVEIERGYLKKIKPSHVYYTNPELQCEETDLIDCPCISVIIPVYNASRYVLSTLDTVINQDLKYIEIICVDDGSTDGSDQLIEEMMVTDPRIKLIKQKNQYAGVARNNGIKSAAADYIVFLDSDDKLERGALMKYYLKAMETDADIVISKAFFLDDKTKQITTAGFTLVESLLPEEPVFRASDIPDHIFNISGGQPWAKCYKRSFVLENGLEFLPIKRSEDFFFVYLSFLRAERITTLSDRLFFYRINNSDSLESTKDEAPLIFWDASVTLINTLKEQGLYEPYERSVLNNLLDRVVYNMRQVNSTRSLEMIFDELKTNMAPLFAFSEREDSYWYSASNLEYVKFFMSLDSLRQYYDSLIIENKRLKMALASRRRVSNATIEKPVTVKRERKLCNKLKLAKKRGFKYVMVRIFKGRAAGDAYLTKHGLW